MLYRERVDDNLETGTSTNFRIFCLFLFFLITTINKSKKKKRIKTYTNDARTLASVTEREGHSCRLGA